MPGAGSLPTSPAIQVWSITYHSWLTFVLLLWACLIWTVRSRHQLAMLCSPFILLYGLALCGLRYVWAMDLSSELPTTLGPVSLRQLGLEHTRYPCLDLGAMVSTPPNCRAPVSSPGALDFCMGVFDNAVLLITQRARRVGGQGGQGLPWLSPGPCWQHRADAEHTTQEGMGGDPIVRAQPSP